jgi:NAD(P)-dependent dehydrogenase (short-subunit alcohol dehydrogenase family)
MQDAILVTGAAGVLGRAVVTELAKQGRQVLAIDLAGAMPDCGQQDFAGGVDLADADAVEDAIERLAGGLAGLAGLANIAGGFAWETVGDGEAGAWQRMFRINLLTALTVTRAALPKLRAGGGAIVNVGAHAALRAGGGMGAYAASKAAVMRLTESLAEEEKDNGVRVNAVLPSIIDTPANRADMPDADPGKWVSPQALAEVVAFLLSPGARDISGALIPVTGRV